MGCPLPALKKIVTRISRLLWGKKKEIQSSKGMVNGRGKGSFLASQKLWLEKKIE